MARPGWVRRLALGALGCALLACGSTSSKGDVAAGEGLAEVEAALEAGSELDALPDLEAEAALPELEAEVVLADLVQDPNGCPATCPPGMCDEEMHWCLACAVDHDCPTPEWWCRQGTCVQTLCVPGRFGCDGTTSVTECAADGLSLSATPCPEGTACRDGGCEPVICQPDEQRCEDQNISQCDPSGTVWYSSHCPPGQGCFGDACIAYRHNVLIVFDTSSSMTSMGALDTIPCICPAGCPAESFPACEQLACPRSKLGMAKYVFDQLFQSEPAKGVTLSLIHFPWDLQDHSGGCNQLMPTPAQGWYTQEMSGTDFMDGDDDSHVTAEGGWYDQGLYQILSVPFPATWQQDTLAEGRRWVNGNEEVGPTPTPCDDKADCPGGFCAADPAQGGQKVCWFHTDPELRAIGNTPLGRTLFYAGEYFRKYIVAEGKACEKSEDCANMNYFCKDGACTDPYRKCRSNQIIVMTDGVEEPPTTTSDFFNPTVQAKRYRYGLGCQDSTDCNQPAYCASDLCGGYPFPYGSGSMGYWLDTTEGQGADRLFDRAGNPIQVTVSVVDMSPQGEAAKQNKSIADNGGGVYFKADSGDPQGLLYQLLQMLDVKANIGCTD
jgi:hypothetical protein